MHWKYSNYQIFHSILANCHTYDEAYRVLRELEEDQDLAIKLALVESKRAQSKVLAAKEVINDTSETRFNKLRSEADVLETDARREVTQACLDEARRTLSFIRLLISKIEPLRLYKHLPDHEAHQAIQPLEWKLDLVWKSYSMLCSSRAFSYDHFINVKMHPDSAELIPVLNDLLLMAQAHDIMPLLRMTKAEVFSKVCPNPSAYIDKPLVTILGDLHEISRIANESASAQLPTAGTN